MTDSITVTGVVGSDPRLHVTPQGLAIASFRLASTRRYFDRTKGTWEDGETNWYTVSGFRQLAHNTMDSVSKGQRVVVHGRLRVRAWDNGEKSGTAIEIEADAIGHDLSWGTTNLTKVRVSREPSTSGDGSAGADMASSLSGAGDSGGWPGVDESHDAAEVESGGALPDDPGARPDEAVQHELV
ncbi:single-stranded DNA-binding protein [Agromyces sp. Marseille-P2726]|uniref:single-stranded DNA-binding protein n=1 Tax=Agromyces sp. Marseille-P2726 TaxID=2709132 RepID=UPI00156E214E|nr:single-stranded DNA-binding protein [Agromyces sp. Marseille-P2726]